MAIVFSILIPSHAATGQEASGFHKFTPKVGNPINAKLIKVSKDWKEMQIQKSDGSSFSVAINLLSLDDQQFVKDWILLQPEKSDFELDVKISKELDGLEREKYGSSGSTKLETRDLTYRVVITNKSRETMVNPIVEYAVVFEDKVRIYQASDGDWTYTTMSTAEEKGISGKETLPDFVYNRDQEIVTKPVKVHKVLGDGNYVYGEDDPKGVLVKISTSNGIMVGLYRSSDSGTGNFTWEDALKAAADSEMRPARRAEDSDEESTQTLSKNTVVSGPFPAQDRDIEFSATIEPSENLNGVVIAIGGKAKGLSLYVDGGQIHLSQVVEKDVKTISAPLPVGEVAITATLTDSLLTLQIGDEVPVTGPSHGFFDGYINAGINVGEDVGSPSQQVGPYEGAFPFAGTIEDASIRFGEVKE